MKRRTIYVILAFVIVAGTVTGWFLWRARSAGEPAQEVRSATVERGTLLIVVAASGSVEPENRVGLSFEVPGRIDEVTVEVGDQVRAGDELARVDAGQLELQVEQAQAALVLAEAQLTQVEAGPRPAQVAAAEAGLRVAQAQLDAAAANRDQVAASTSSAQVAGAEAQLANARLQQKTAQDALDKVTGDERSSERDKEQARYKLYVAGKALVAAQAQLDELRAGADPNEVRASQANVLTATALRDGAQAQLDLLQVGATAEQVADVEAQVAQAQAALELAQLSLEGAVLRAPFDGIVATVNVRLGDIAPSGLPAVVLLDTSRLHVDVSVDEIDVSRLVVGQSVEVTVDALPDTVIAGTVDRIAPVARLEGGVVFYDVVIGLAPSAEPIRVGMTANASVTVEELPDVLQVPTWVVRVDRITGQTYVQRRAGQDVERVDVALGVRYEGVAQVLSGLSEGDVVVYVEETTAFGIGEQ